MNKHLDSMLAVALLAIVATPAMAQSVAPETGKALAYSYTMPVEANLTLGVFDAQGLLLRTLVRDERRRAGANTESWDGLDQYGQPMPAGTYQVKAIYHPPLGVDYQMTVANPGNPPWPTADDKGDWLSDEAAPQGVATDGKWVFLAAPGSEKGHALIAVDEQSRRQWGFHKEIYPRCVSLALGGDYLYALYSGPELTDNAGRFNGKNAIERAILVCLDKRSGRPARFTQNTPNTRVATWPYREDVHPLWDLRANKGFTPATYGGQPRYFAEDIGESTGALGLAATAERLYVSLFYEDKLLVLDAGTAQKVDEIPLPKPVGLHALPDGQLLAVSGTSVVKINPATKQVAPLVTSGLVAPHSLTGDARGNVYVSDWGASFQVKVFDAAGKRLRAIGQPGGRPWVGAWQPDGMLVPRGVAVTEGGALWVAEDDMNPPRVSVWDAQSGAFVRDYLGPATYGGGPPFWLDPKDPTQGFTLGVLFRLDPAKRTWTPVAQPIRRLSRDQPFASYLNSAVSSAPHRFFTRGGQDYIVVNGYQMAIVLRRDGDRFTPVAALGGLSRLTVGDGSSKTVWDSDIGRHEYRNWYPEFFKGHAGDNFAWSDADNDGLVQAAEMRWAPTVNRFAPYVEGRQPEWLMGWGAGIAPDWSIFWSGFNKDKQATYRVDLQGWTPAGAPLYDINNSRRILLSDAGEGVNGLYVNDENKLFVSHTYDWNPQSKDALSCHDRDGRYLWGVARPKAQSNQDVLAENVVGEFQLPGIGNVLGTWLWHANYRPYLLTSDGLYIGTLLEDTRLGPAAKWDESFKFAYQSPVGTPYLVNGANDAYHLLKITGLESAKRFAGTLTLSEADVQTAAASRAVAATAPKPAPPPILHVTWLGNAPRVDGDLTDWNMDAGATLTGSQDRTARIALGRDAKNLYVAAAVQGARLANKGTDWQTLFISGDAVDVMLSTGAAARTAHYQPAEGDARLLFSIYQGKPIAVLYRPVAPGTATPVQLMAARIDQIVRLTGARLAFVRGKDFYTLEAAVPLADLAIDPRENGTLKGDVGVVYADETGTNRALRLYFYNRNTNLTADLTTEATLQPGEWGPVEFPLGANLLDYPGFEGPLEDNLTEGWVVTDQRSGATASIATDSPHSGTHSLLLEQTAPVTFPAAAYNLPDYGEFGRSANDGKGNGFVAVKQTVPVTPGKQYALRLHFRAQGLTPEKKAPGPGRGYAAFGPWVYWNKGGAVWVANEQSDPDGWKTLLNAQTNVWTITKPYVAPAEATAATISLQMTTQVADKMPKVWVDDVEFVEVEPDK